LISVSLAPGSYFFCADAALAAIAAAATTASAICFLLRPGIVLSRLAFYFDQVSQAARGHASAGLFRRTKQHCCAAPIMIDAGQELDRHRLRPPD
jgi:hypothetical protein